MDKTISEKEYQRLLDAEFKLQCLEAGGVDNWEGYSDALWAGGYFSDEDDDNPFIEDDR